jgi:Protein ChrB, N-terminal
MVQGDVGVGTWVMLCYRIPREPSTPRITVWRKLRRLGVAQLADGLVALPADTRTREQLESIADEITEAGGEASIWLAQPASTAQERDLAARMAAARANEYAAVAEAGAVAAARGREGRRTGERLRAELRRIGRRDYFPPPERDIAHAAVRALLNRTGSDDTGDDAEESRS